MASALTKKYYKMIADVIARHPDVPVPFILDLTEVFAQDNAFFSRKKFIDATKVRD